MRHQIEYLAPDPRPDWFVSGVRVPGLGRVHLGGVCGT